MENIILFAVSVLLYCVLWFGFLRPKSGVECAKRIALIAVLCIPFNINGNVFTVMGNATAERSIYSFFSLYQKADHDAVTVLGLTGYQQAGNNALTGIGLAAYQQAGRDTVTMVGLTGYQQAGHDTVTAVGFTAYQRAGNMAKIGAGLAFYQKVGGKTRSFGVYSELKN